MAVRQLTGWPTPIRCCKIRSSTSPQNIGGWDPLLIVDCGPKILVGGKPQVIPDDGGNLDGRGRFLDGNGGLLNGTGLIGANPPVYLKFHVKNKMAFKGLNLIPPWDPSYHPWGTVPAKKGNP